MLGGSNPCSAGRSGTGPVAAEEAAGAAGHGVPDPCDQ
uniref:Uncharacterized protein n=1 Tax=Siphoviridae sp. ctZF426 TaxID=2827580 RepID=A0A8S5RT12_9CAUD|nr:MAG TPA: hypothetical protein [Siphoviridae sp. ctZF426]